MKRLFMLSIFSMILFFGFIGTAFTQNLSDIEAEELIKQERSLSEHGSTNRDISEFSPSYEDLLNNLKEVLIKKERNIGNSRDTWISKNPDDLKPLMGTKWKFTYTIIIDFTETITFGTAITTTDAGNVGLVCYDKYGNMTAVIYVDMPILGRVYAIIVYGSIIDKYFLFNISGNYATGKYVHKSHSTGEYSNFYPLTGIKISGPQAQAPVANAGTNQTVDECENLSLNGSNSSDTDGYIASYLWQQTGGPSVTLSSPIIAKPNFFAPCGIQNNVYLSFKLTVTDNGGLKDIDTVVITVKPKPAGSSCPDGDIAPFGSPDGKINVGDALLCLRFALGLEQGHPTADELIHGDVAPLDANGCPNPDGQINVADALVTLRLALGLINFSNCTPETTKLTIGLTGVASGTSLGSLDLTIDYDESKATFNTVAVGSLTSGATVIPNDNGDTVRTGLIKAYGFDSGASGSIMVLTFDIIQPNIPANEDFFVTGFSATDVMGADAGLDFSNISIAVVNN